MSGVLLSVLQRGLFTHAAKLAISFIAASSAAIPQLLGAFKGNLRESIACCGLEVLKANIDMQGCWQLYDWAQEKVIGKPPPPQHIY